MLRRALALAATALMLSTTAVFADSVQSSDVQTNAGGGSVGYTAGAAAVTVFYWINAQGACDAADGSPATINLGASLNNVATSAVTISPSSFQLSACGDANNAANKQAVQISSAASLAPATYRVEVVTVTDTAGNYSYNGAGFNFVVSGPANAAPIVGTLSFSPNPVACQTSTTLTIPFTDSGSTSWFADIDWDYDGTFVSDTTTASVTASPITASHTYAAPGTHTVGVVVTDNQGAASSPVKTGSIDVLQTYSNSFLQPIDGLQTTGKKNTFKNGRVLPVKVVITDVCTGDPVTGSTGEVVTAAVTQTPILGGGTDPVESFADAGASSGNSNLFRWSLDGFWIYNLDSKALGMQSGSTYELKVVVDGIAASQTAALQPTK